MRTFSNPSAFASLPMNRRIESTNGHPGWSSAFGRNDALEESRLWERSAAFRPNHYPQFSGNVFAESQRDSATKPRVARNELPWDRIVDISNPERVASSCVPWLTQPCWGCDRNERPPRVVALLQPWALRRNPFGIQNFIMKDWVITRGFSPLHRR